MVDRVHNDSERKYIQISQPEKLFWNEEAERRFEGVSHGKIWEKNSWKKEQV